MAKINLAGLGSMLSRYRKILESLGRHFSVILPEVPWIEEDMERLKLLDEQLRNTRLAEGDVVELIGEKHYRGLESGEGVN